MEKKNKEKFEFQPKQWVLARDADCEEWTLCQFSHYTEDEMFPYGICGGTSWNKCIPYEGNEHLRGTTDPYVETKSESEYVPKDGDFVVSGWKQNDGSFCEWIAIVKGDADEYGYDSYFGMVTKQHPEQKAEYWFNSFCDAQEYTRPARSEETKAILSKLHNIGKDWNKETKQIVAYNPPYEPKDGDFVAIETEHFLWISIFKKFDGDKVFTYADYMMNCNDLGRVDETGGGFLCLRDDMERFRPATEDEIDKFVDAYKDAGKVWNAEEKVFEKYEWKPSMGDTYYYPDFNRILCIFEPCETQSSEDAVDSIRIERNIVSRTEEECQTVCDKLNAALESVEGYVDSER